MAKPGNDRRIDNIELAVSDIARSRAFYGKVFGWTFTDYGPAYCEFTDGRLTGGLAKGTPVTPGGPLVILYADDLASPNGSDAASPFSIKPRVSGLQRSCARCPRSTAW